MSTLAAVLEAAQLTHLSDALTGTTLEELQAYIAVGPVPKIHMADAAHASFIDTFYVQSRVVCRKQTTKWYSDIFFVFCVILGFRFIFT